MNSVIKWVIHLQKYFFEKSLALAVAILDFGKISPGQLYLIKLKTE